MNKFRKSSIYASHYIFLVAFRKNMRVSDASSLGHIILWTKSLIVDNNILKYSLFIKGDAFVVKAKNRRLVGHEVKEFNSK